jgi:hypothetical protein
VSRDFNGAGDYLSHAAALVSGPPFTVASRFNIDSIAAFNTLLSVMAAASNQGFHMSILTDGRGAFQARDSAGIFRNALTSNTYTINTWSSCVGIATSTTSRQVFLNGDIANGGLNNDSCAPAALDITEFGRFEPTGTSYVNGRAAELAIWDETLTEGEIQAYNDGVSPRSIRPANLIAYWPLLGNNTPEVDPIGGFEFTLTGTPTKAEHPLVFMPKKKKLYVFIPGTSTYPVSLSTTVPRTAAISHQNNLIIQATAPRIPTITRISQLFRTFIRVGVASVVVQVPTIIAVNISVVVGHVTSLIEIASAGARKFVGHAGLGLLWRPVTRWTRRR